MPQTNGRTISVLIPNETWDILHERQINYLQSGLTMEQFVAYAVGSLNCPVRETGRALGASEPAPDMFQPLAGSDPRATF